MDSWELTCREQIRDLLARYTWAGDRGRIEELADLFTARGALDVGEHGGRWVGRAEIVAGLQAVIDRTAPSPSSAPGPVHHHVSSVLITDLSGGQAKVKSYFAVHTTIGLDHWGRYFDNVELEIGRWRFAQRMVVVDGASPGSLMVRRP